MLKQWLTVNFAVDTPKCWVTSTTYCDFSIFLFYVHIACKLYHIRQDGYESCMIAIESMFHHCKKVILPGVECFKFTLKCMGTCFELVVDKAQGASGVLQYILTADKLLLKSRHQAKRSQHCRWAEKPFQIYWIVPRCYYKPIIFIVI